MYVAGTWEVSSLKKIVWSKDLETGFDVIDMQHKELVGKINKLIDVLQGIDDETIKNESKIRIDIVKKIRAALGRDDMNSISGLLRVRGIADKSLEKLFNYIRNGRERHLFN
jgi:hypothetical protein